MSTTLSTFNSHQELNSESEHASLMAQQDSTVLSLSNGVAGGKKNLPTKPPPPAQPKPTRFLKKSLTHNSLPRFGKSTTDSKGKEIKESNNESKGKEEVIESKRQLRESPLWKLPGISTLKKNRRHSAVVDAVMPSEGNTQTRLSVTPPEQRKNPNIILSSSPSTAHQQRQLPPLPTIPPLGVPITITTTDTNSQTRAHAEMSSTNAPLESDTGDLQIPSESEHHLDNTSMEISLSRSSESLTHQVSHTPQLSGTPRSTSVHSFTENGEVEKADTIYSIIEKYHRYVPVRIRVLQGYCSDTADINISTGDLYDVQLMKTTKVVTIRDQDGMTFRIPLESSTKFGLVFNLSSNYDEGLCGYTFRTVSDLTSLSTLPRVVCTVSEFQGNDLRSSVQQNEILVVQQALKSMFRGKRGIKVYSLLTRTEKILPEDCDVGLSTNPSLVRMHLSDIIEHIADPFPAHAVMYPTTDNTDEDIPGTLSRVITMLDYSTKESLTVSAVVGENDDTSTDESTYFEIPLDEDMKEIEVSVLKWSTPPESPELEEKVIVSDTSSYDDDDDDHVYDDTINLLQTSDVLRTLAAGQRNTNSNEDSPNSHHLVHESVSPPLPDKPGWLLNLPHGNEGSHSNETTMTVSSKYDNISPGLPAVPTDKGLNHQVSEEDPDYDTIGAHLLNKGVVESETSRYNKLHSDTSDSGDPRVMSWMEDLQLATNKLESRIMSLEHFQKNTVESTEIKQMQNLLEQMAQKVESLESQLRTMSLSTPLTSQVYSGAEEIRSTSEHPLTEEESNKCYLQSMDVGKVCELIVAMGLGQYKEKFMSEHISGEILLECDEEMLKDELDIRSRIHRVRLAKLISGTHSVKQFLDT